MSLEASTAVTVKSVVGPLDPKNLAVLCADTDVSEEHDIVFCLVSSLYLYFTYFSP
jgi:hypothetical protein